MSHEILENDNMISVREVPWHGLGIVLPEAPTCEEAQRLAGLNWTVRKEPIYYRQPEINGFSRIREVEGQFAIVRNDNQAPLGVVGKNYEPFQNGQMFEFMARFLDAAHSQIETCGSLRNGAIVWALATAGQMEYVKGDPVGKYFLFKNGFDASQNVEILFTDVRVVCNNTLQAALHEARNGYRVRHTASVHAQVAAIGEAINSQKAYSRALAERMAAMARKTLSLKDMESILTKIVRKDIVDVEEIADSGRELSGEEIKQGLTNFQKKTTARILELSETGAGTDIPGVKGTAYGLLNACTEWADHERTLRPGEKSYAEAKFTSVMFQTAAQFKQRAFTQIADYVAKAA